MKKKYHLKNILFIITSMLFLLSCNKGNTDKDIAKKKPKIHKKWFLPENPVLKVISITPELSLALTEEHLVGIKKNSIYYQHDHHRKLYLLKSNETVEEINLNFSSIESKMITDIAIGPHDNTFWVSFTGLSYDQKKLEHSILLITHVDSRPTIEWSITDSATFGSADNIISDWAGFSYSPYDTLDVSRIDSYKNELGLVARNINGTLYADRYVFSDSTWKRTSRTLISTPIINIRLAMTGGSYDVMGQLVNHYKVHAAFDQNGVLYVGSVADRDEIIENNKIFDYKNDLSSNKRTDKYAYIVGVNSNGKREKPQLLKLSWDNHLLQKIKIIKGKIFIAALKRDHKKSNGESHLVISELGSWQKEINVKKQSGSAQALALHPDYGLFIGGSWNWSQNPEGLSISQGQGHIGIYNKEDDSFKTYYEHSQSSARSEVRSLWFPSNDILCEAGMTNGPDTHRADNDASLVKGDGYVQCFFMNDN